MENGSEDKNKKTVTCFMYRYVRSLFTRGVLKREEKK